MGWFNSAPEDLQPGDEFDGKTVEGTMQGNGGKVRVLFANGTFTEKDKGK